MVLNRIKKEFFFSRETMLCDLGGSGCEQNNLPDVEQQHMERQLDENKSIKIERDSC